MIIHIYIYIHKAFWNILFYKLLSWSGSPVRWAILINRSNHNLLRLGQGCEILDAGVQGSWCLPHEPCRRRQPNRTAACATPPSQTVPNNKLSWKHLKALEVESVLSEQLSKTLWTTVDGENCAICLDRDSTPPTKFQPLVPNVNKVIIYWPCMTRSDLLV